jgi:predicted SprT family Zn-dependent metalloprotease
LLTKIFQELNEEHFEGELPLPKLNWNPRLSSTAGRFTPGSRSRFFGRDPQIEVATYLTGIPDGWLHVRDTVLHEMIHYLLWHRRRPYGHSAEFHQILKRVGAKRYNPVPKQRPVKYFYECPACLTQVPARRRIGMYACASCCERHNNGRFAERFRLRLAQRAPVAENACVSTPAPAPEKENARIPPLEIVRRLEELKQLISQKA